MDKALRKMPQLNTTDMHPVWDTIINILQWVLTGGVGLFIAKVIVDHIRKKKLKKRPITNTYSQIASIYDAMGDMLNHTPADQILIWRSTNGGGIPKPGSYNHISVIHEDYRDIISRKSKYQKITLDKDLIRLLIKLSTEEKVSIKINDLEDGRFKTMLKSDGIKYAELYYLYETNKEFFFMCVGTSQIEDVCDDPSSRNIVNLAVDKIQNVFIDNY